MYTTLLHIHSITRWLILISIFIAIILAYSGWFSGRKWKNFDNVAGLLLVIIADIQLLFGFLLYFVYSPFSKAAFSDFGAAMKEQELRFYAVEHSLLMLLAVIMVHVGRSKTKKAGNTINKFKISAIYYTIALIVILAAIPWSRGIF
jgi:hypothetical protein